MFLFICYFMGAEDRAIFRKATSNCEVQKKILDEKILDIQKKIEILKQRQFESDENEVRNDLEIQKLDQRVSKLQPINQQEGKVITEKIVQMKAEKESLSNAEVVTESKIEKNRLTLNNLLQPINSLFNADNHNILTRSGFKNIPEQIIKHHPEDQNMFEKVQTFIDSGFKRLSFLAIPEVRDIIFNDDEPSVEDIPDTPESPVYNWNDTLDKTPKHIPKSPKTTIISKILKSPPKTLTSKITTTTTKPFSKNAVPFLSNIYTRILPPNTKLPLSSSQNCPFELNSDYADTKTLNSIRPLLSSIRRDHFLMNLSPFGPNNQLRGFRDTLLLAVFLNRTIVLPPFFKHRTDPSSILDGYHYQDAQQKLDAIEIAKFMPVVTLDEFSKICSSSYTGKLGETAGIDEIFLARQNSLVSELKSKKIETFELITQLRIINPMKNGVLSKVTVNPDFFRNEKNAKKRDPQVYVEMNDVTVNRAYGSGTDTIDGKCAIWLEPYRNMHFSNHLSNWVYKFGMNVEDEKVYSNFGENDDSVQILKSIPGELAARMMKATCRAKSVRTAAQEFLKVVLGMENVSEKFFALHWRYDDTDFGRHCDKNRGGSLLCGMLSLVDMRPLGQRLGQYINYVSAKYETAMSQPKNLTLPRVQFQSLYLATPPSNMKKLQPMINEIVDLGVKVVTGTDLNEWVQEKYSKNCDAKMMADEVHDFTSQVEMEICSISGLFLSSDGSSWSENIKMERQAKRIHWWDRSNTQFLAKDKEGNYL